MAEYDGDLAALPREQQQEVFRSIGTQLMFQEIKDRLHSFGVDFDVYFHEDSLHESGAVERAIERLREQGHIFEADGAIWLRTTTFGDDRDRVVIRSNGEPAYISGDLGYYLDKRERGFEQNIIMLGADHHGYIGRMMAMVEAFGDVPNVNLQILIGQMVNLVKDGEPMRMSKRAGTIVTLDDLVDAVGVDAARYSLVRSSTDSQLDIDLDLLAKRSNENPVYYVQYAHARTRSVAANAEKAGVDRSAFAPELLTRPSRRCSAACRSSRASSRRRPSCANRTASPATSRSWPGCTTPGTRSATARPACCRTATSRSPTCTAPACG